jgi:hypothetical protein
LQSCGGIAETQRMTPRHLHRDKDTLDTLDIRDIPRVDTVKTLFLNKSGMLSIGFNTVEFSRILHY